VKLKGLKRVRLKIKGIVQGVGFRPTVYKHATNNSVSGFVVNTPDGVTVELEGTKRQVEDVINLIIQEPPRMSKITEYVTEWIEATGASDFVILKSTNFGAKETEISPDISICQECSKEIFDVNDRRYLYPFTNCTNCGPRFSIIKDRPYDRPNTSMRDFKMCDACNKEYNDPSNRRFHAQPNACPVCGPKIFIIHKNGLDEVDVMNKTIFDIKDGKLIAIKSIGGFNIACDAFNVSSVERLRNKKKRGTRSFAVMMKDLDVVNKFCFVGQEELKILTSQIAPIVILRKKNNELDHISPDNNYIGVMLPYTPLHKILMKDIDVLVMTSANRADEPIAVNDEQALSLLDEGLIDSILSNNRDIINRCDDSIIQHVDGVNILIRRARGHVPNGLIVKELDDANKISLGADIKNTFSLKKGKKIYVSQYIGDLDDPRNVQYQEQQIGEFKKLLEMDASVINIDAHPGYANYNKNRNMIYHHHAHALSVMAENDLLGKDVFAVICDGTGYGDDGNVWGFELFKIGRDYKNYKRHAHLDYFLLPGGDVCSREIDRIAVSLCSEANLENIPNIDSKRKQLINNLISSKINCYKCSSLGRLFDGVASICGISNLSLYEAQAAMLLQKYAENFKGKILSKYKVEIINGNIDYRSLVRELVRDIKSGLCKEELAYKFHLWIKDSILLFINSEKPKDVVFSGGCFQNSLLLKLLLEDLNKYKDLKVYFNQDFPSNDGGISLGQSVI
jgi:hydrogenase maturation protein HypF